MSRAEQFLDLYVQHRLQDQRGYYQNRRDEFEAAQQQANLLAGLLMVSAAIASSAAATGIPIKAVWVVLAITLPAVAGLSQALQRLFAYERLAKLYDDAARALTSVGPQPTLDHNNPDAGGAVAAYVARIEEVLTKEQGQWGQLTASLDTYKTSKTDK